jgi:hypothetical protein
MLELQASTTTPNISFPSLNSGTWQVLYPFSHLPQFAVLLRLVLNSCTLVTFLSPPELLGTWACATWICVAPVCRTNYREQKVQAGSFVEVEQVWWPGLGWEWQLWRLGSSERGLRSGTDG